MTATALSYRTAEEINSAMAGVYKHMAIAVLVSMLTAMAVASMPAVMTFLFSGLMKWVVIFAPLVACLAISVALQRGVTAGQGQAMLLGFAALMGLSFSTIFVVFKLGSIVSAFFSGAVLFTVMSGYGYFTRRSLDSVGQFLIVGVIAIVIASVVNIFVGSGIAQMVISALAVIIFAGLTAYDSQKIREQIMEGTTASAEILGALSLYINFINIFLSLLQLFGTREE